MAAYLAKNVPWPVPVDWPRKKHYWRDVGRDGVADRIVWRCLKCGIKTLLQESGRDGPCQLAVKVALPPC